MAYKKIAFHIYANVALYPAALLGYEAYICAFSKVS
jgi:hypothetical protein